MISNIEFSDLYRLAGYLELRASNSENLRVLKEEVEHTLDWAEANSAPMDLLIRLDELLLKLTEASRENVCTNAKCPQYNKKCRMR
jgi:hypothetical protein